MAERVDNVDHARVIPPNWRNPRWTTARCLACARAHDPAALLTVCDACGLPLGVEYDLDTSVMPRKAVTGRVASLWRYAEVLPVDPSHAVTLGEGMTPLLQVEPRVWIKDEAQNPTGSFKARGMALAVSVARAHGVAALRAPSAGNAAGALAAYGAAAGLPVTVALPRDTPAIFVDECRHYGAEVVLVDGTIADAGRWLRAHGPAEAFDISTLREPHRIEGKKTMGYELIEQLGTPPDVIFYPTGGGTGLVGMARAFAEMQRMGWLSARVPRLVSVQVEGCAPVVRAFERGEARTEPWIDPVTRAWGLRVPAPLGGFACLDALRATSGTAIAVPEAEMARATSVLARRTGVDVCPEGGAAWAALERMRACGLLHDHETAVVFNTGTGLKYR